MSDRRVNILTHGLAHDPDDERMKLALWSARLDTDRSRRSARGSRCSADHQKLWYNSSDGSFVNVDSLFVRREWFRMKFFTTDSTVVVLQDANAVYEASLFAGASAGCDVVFASLDDEDRAAVMKHITQTISGKK